MFHFNLAWIHSKDGKIGSVFRKSELWIAITIQNEILQVQFHLYPLAGPHLVITKIILLKTQDKSNCKPHSGEKPLFKMIKSVKTIKSVAGQIIAHCLKYVNIWLKTNLHNSYTYQIAKSHFVRAWSWNFKRNVTKTSSSSACPGDEQRGQTNILRSNKEALSGPNPVSMAWWRTPDEDLVTTDQ